MEASSRARGFIARLWDAGAIAEGRALLDTALALVMALEPRLDGYQPFHAAQAALLARAGRNADSRAAYDRAIQLAPSAQDAAFLVRARENLPPDGQSEIIPPT